MARRPATPADDPRQGALFDTGFCRLPAPAIALPGSLGCATRICGLIGYCLDTARLERGIGREEVAARMAELTGERITAGMLNAMTAESHQGHRFPLQWLPALVEVTGCYEPLSAIAELVGALVLVGADAVDAKVGRIDRTIERLRAERRRITRASGGRHG